MKTTIFICLLSLTMCLTAPQTSTDAHKQNEATPGQPIEHTQQTQDPKTATPNPNTTDITIASNVSTDSKPQINDNNSKLKEATDSNKQTANTHPENNANQTTKVTIDDNKNTLPNNTKPDDAAKKSDAAAKKSDDGAKKSDDTAEKTDDATKKSDDATKKPENNQTVVPQPPTANNATADKNNSIANNTKPDDNKKPEKDSTTPVPPAKPTEHTKTDEIVPARSFDGPSFIGGMVLTLGLLGLSFMGLKYYKAQTERNYHTL